MKVVHQLSLSDKENSVFGFKPLCANCVKIVADRRAKRGPAPEPALLPISRSIKLTGQYYDLQGKIPDVFSAVWDEAKKAGLDPSTGIFEVRVTLTDAKKKP
jgi:hypothetical protein